MGEREDSILTGFQWIVDMFAPWTTVVHDANKHLITYRKNQAVDKNRFMVIEKQLRTGIHLKYDGNDTNSRNH